MANYFKTHFTGERALFMLRDSYVEDCLFDDGESPLKEARSLDVVHCDFGYKYPLWYGKKIVVVDSHFSETSRAGVWYTEEASFRHCAFDGPKFFRKCTGLKLEDVEFNNGLETLWWCQHVQISDANVINAPYFGMGCEDVVIDHMDLRGDYAFDGAKNVRIISSVLRSKDAFWNAENVVLEGCYIEGEYFGWNAKNVTLSHCEIHSHQGFCYMKGITLRGCRVVDSDLTFEYCEDINADIVTPVDSIKNPLSGVIYCFEGTDIIFDDPNVDPSKVEIKIRG